MRLVNVEAMVISA